jgi:hypothetical protein
MQWFVSCSDSCCLNLVKEIYVSSFSDFCSSFQSLAADNWKESGQRRSWLWGWPVRYTCWSACYGWVLLWWPVIWDKAGLYLAKTCRWPGASGFGDQYEAMASQRERTSRSGGRYMGRWWQNGWHCYRLHPICWVECWRLYCKWHRRSWGSVGWSVLRGYIWQHEWRMICFKIGSRF